MRAFALCLLLLNLALAGWWWHSGAWRAPPEPARLPAVDGGAATLRLLDELPPPEACVDPASPGDGPAGEEKLCETIAPRD